MRENINWCENAETYINAEMFKEAVACYDLELEAHPDNIDALEYKGACLLELNRKQESEECFDKAVEIAERELCVLVNRGMALKNKGELWEALILFDKALDILPGDEDALQCVDYILDKLINQES